MKVITIPVAYGSTNCYLLCDQREKRCAVVDPGADPEKIRSAVLASDCTPEAVLLTHGHSDHVGAVDALRTFWPELPVYLNDRDVRESDVRLYRRLFPMVKETRSYDEGDVIRIGSLEVRVLATPGHSAGSVSLLAEDVLLSGDALFACGMGRTDLPGGSETEMTATLARLGALEGNFSVLPGHGRASTLAIERSENPCLRQALQAAAGPAEETIRLYTRQNDKTLLELERTGRVINRSYYVRLHFGDMAEHYLESYAWFAGEAAKRVPRPADVTTSIWCSISAEACFRPGPGSVVYVLEVPRSQVVFFDETKWDYVLDRIYLPENDEDKRRYLAHLERLGIRSSYDLFREKYRGLFEEERARIRESWKRVFTIDRWTVHNVCGNIWEIRKEWVRKIVRPGEAIE